MVFADDSAHIFFMEFERGEMPRRLVIVGCGGFAREVLQLVRDINAETITWNCEGFLVDPQFAPDGLIQGLPALGGLEWLENNPDVEIVIAVGSPVGRREIATRIRRTWMNPFAKLIHPRAWVGQAVEIGDGTIICAGALITTDIKLGEHVHVNIGATIGHDSVLRDFVTLNPSVNVSGNVVLEEGNSIGTGTVIIPHCNIGCWSIIGAGSVVTKSLGPNITAVGMPARAVKERAPGWHEAIAPSD
jgi:sugar O-acyltransferase (sialic acid O-acetyltransferase NeuD family)